MKIKTGIGYRYTAVYLEKTSYLDQQSNTIEIFDNEEHLGSLIFENMNLRGVLFNTLNDSINKGYKSFLDLLRYYIDEITDWAFPKIRGQGDTNNEADNQNEKQ